MGKRQEKEWHYTGDTDVLGYGGMFIRHVSGSRWHVVRLTNMDDACGRDNDGYPKYVVELDEVDLDIINRDSVASYTSLYDWFDGEPTEPAWVEAAVSYGQLAPLDSVTTNNGWKGIYDMKRESKRLGRDEEAYEDRMSRPVNGIGQSAREFQQGDMVAALERGVAAGDDTCKLVTKIYQNCNGRTLAGGIIDVSHIELEDN